MWNGKMKALTFSYDDGVEQDKRLIEMFDKYGLKATFNINSGLFGKRENLIRLGVEIGHDRIPKEEAKEVYKNHEVAAHTLTHPNLVYIEDEKQIIKEVEEDRADLSKIFGYNIDGMAYPGGGINNDKRVADIIKLNTGIRWARGTTSTYSFDVPENLIQYNPSVYHIMQLDEMFSLGEKFLKLTPDKPQLFYVWGHSYEFDIHDTWDKMEDFCKMMQGKDDIYYCTNSQAFHDFLK